jgi:hypothetical protein
MVTSDSAHSKGRKVERQIRMLKWETHKHRGTQTTLTYSLPFEEGNELKIGTRNWLYLDWIYLTSNRV